MTHRTLITLILGAVLALPLPASAAQVILTAALTGGNEPAGGDSDGTGSFSATVDADAGDFCYTLTAAQIAKPTMAHVHSGAAGTNGPPVLTIHVASDECIAPDPDVLKAIVRAPQNYYVNVHTADFPAGAIRGQLAGR